MHRERDIMIIFWNHPQNGKNIISWHRIRELDDVAEAFIEAIHAHYGGFLATDDSLKYYSKEIGYTAPTLEEVRDRYLKRFAKNIDFRQKTANN